MITPYLFSQYIPREYREEAARLRYGYSIWSDTPRASIPGKRHECCPFGIIFHYALEDRPEVYLPIMYAETPTNIDAFNAMIYFGWVDPEQENTEEILSSIVEFMEDFDAYELHPKSLPEALGLT